LTPSVAVRAGHPQQLSSMTMQDQDGPFPVTSKRTAWNKGKLIGAKAAASAKTCLVNPK
jgi:hypothetical protein